MSRTHPGRASFARVALVCFLLGLPIAGCAATAATLPQRNAALEQASPHPPNTAAMPIDHLTAVAMRRYATEVHGAQARATMGRVASDPALLRALASGDPAKARAYVRRQFNRVWYHWHVSRLRILRAKSTLVDVGVPFVVAPSQVTVRDPRGAALGTLQVSIQDVIGFVRYMHRNYPVDIVVRGRDATHARTSLPAALHVRLPDSGHATVAGKPYQVRSFTETALGGEPVKVWILQGG